MNINSIYESITNNTKQLDYDELPPIIESDARTYLGNLSKKRYATINEIAADPVQPAPAPAARQTTPAAPQATSIDNVLVAIKNRFNSLANEESKQILLSVLNGLAKK